MKNAIVIRSSSFNNADTWNSYAARGTISACTYQLYGNDVHHLNPSAAPSPRGFLVKLPSRKAVKNLPHRRTMSKEYCIEVTGTIVEKFPSGLFSVQLDQERTVLAHLAGKLRRNRIRVLAGDRVTLELSPYDLTKGRITYRHK